jgi:hypothetical protein
MVGKPVALRLPTAAGLYEIRSTCSSTVTMPTHGVVHARQPNNMSKVSHTPLDVRPCQWAGRHTKTGNEAIKPCSVLCLLLWRHMPRLVFVLSWSIPTINQLNTDLSLSTRSVQEQVMSTKQYNWIESKRTRCQRDGNLK